MVSGRLLLPDCYREYMHIDTVYDRNEISCHLTSRPLDLFSISACRSYLPLNVSVCVHMRVPVGVYLCGPVCLSACPLAVFRVEWSVYLAICGWDVFSIPKASKSLHVCGRCVEFLPEWKSSHSTALYAI